MARLIDEKTLRLELDKLNCIDKFGYVILPITKFNIALKISTVDAVPVVHAHWVSLEPVIGLYECSLCGHKILRSKCNYCPNCGSKMGGERKGGDE